MNKSDKLTNNPLVWIGLGANLGHPLRQLIHARKSLEQDLAVVGVSSLYRSEPVDCPLPQNDFLNAVMCAHTCLSPQELLNYLQELEQTFGRTRESYHAPRTLDLDILMYNSLELKTDTLTLPHPALLERAFVLKPLSELSPALILSNHMTIQEALLHVSDQKIEYYPHDEWGFKSLNTC